VAQAALLVFDAGQLLVFQKGSFCEQVRITTVLM